MPLKVLPGENQQVQIYKKKFLRGWDPNMFQPSPLHFCYEPKGTPNQKNGILYFALPSSTFGFQFFCVLIHNRGESKHKFVVGFVVGFVMGFVVCQLFLNGPLHFC